MNGDQILAMLRKELEARKEWDERPVLQAMYSNGGDIRVGGEIIEPMMWAGERPPDVLAWAAEMLNESAGDLLSRNAPSDFYGILFRHEGWMLMVVPASSPDEVEAVNKAAEDHIIHRHPQRIEVRSAYAATADGLYSVTVPRDTSIEPIVLTPDDKSEGTVPEALIKIFRSLAGLPA